MLFDYPTNCQGESKTYIHRTQPNVKQELDARVF